MNYPDKPIVPANISQVNNPVDLLQEPGDKLSVEITETKRRVSKLHTKGFKRSKTEYPSGKVVETISY